MCDNAKLSLEVEVRKEDTDAVHRLIRRCAQSIWTLHPDATGTVTITTDEPSIPWAKK